MNDISVEELVQNAIGDSVTPSQLLDSNTVGFFRRIIGHKGVEGPFTDHLQDGEQPHYVFHSTSTLSIPVEEDTDSDDHITVLGDSYVSPVVAIITDKRSIFVYRSGDTQRVISILHNDLIDAEFTDYKAEKELLLQTTQRKVVFGMWVTDPYSSEVADAAAYIIDQSGFEKDHQEYGFESDDFNDARSALKQQLKGINLTDQIDLETVARYAVKGANIGKFRSTYGAGVGFVLGAGYGMWSELSVDDEGRGGIEDIDPEETAEIMLKWQQAGKYADKKSLELASGAFGAAITIDKQTSGREVSSMLAELDIDWVARQLEEGNHKDAGLKVASDAIESYSNEISSLLDEDFFTQLERTQSET